MTIKAWNGANGQFDDGVNWSPAETPVAGDTATISTGTVLATSLTLGGLGILIQSTATTGGSFGLVNSVLASDSTLTVRNPNAPYGSGTSPVLTIQGTATNNGTISFTGAAAFVPMSNGAGSGTLVNNGVISIADASPQFQAAAGSTAPVLTNNGTITVTHPTTSTFQSPVINATINGTGTISVGANGKLDLAGSVGAGQTLAFTGGVGAGAVVQVDRPGAFNATISQFVSGDTITVTNTPYTRFAYTSNGASSGVLTLYNGATATANLVYSGVYSQSVFSANYTDLGGGASTLAITTSVTNTATGATGTGTGGAVGAVYRFFDTKYGTHFFTSDVGERNTVQATRPDLLQETNGFGDVAPNDPNAIAVYRFFDKVYGTHFFTANAGERDTVIATRSDLAYESGSTFYEHSTLQAGDTPVYRLFDQVTGTQFLTGDRGEYNGIKDPASATYRSDLRDEGVAFYAPTGSFR